jgi:branched-subunit amino acid aminotransferase/4-amino-4-deoxychorismate lyase
MPLLAKNKLTHGNARIRTTVTGGISDRPLGLGEIPTIVIAAAASGAAGNLPPLTCAVISSHPRVAGDVLENCKRSDYTRSFAARRKAQELGAEEAILTNTKGDIACGATSNIFIEEKGVLVTPPLSEGVLAGITRAKVIKIRGAREEPISERRLRDADAVYLTNSFFGMRTAVLK